MTRKEYEDLELAYRCRACWSYINIMHTYYLKGSSIYASFSNADVKLRFKCAFLMLLTNSKVPFLAKAILYPIIIIIKDRLHELSQENHIVIASLTWSMKIYHFISKSSWISPIRERQIKSRMNEHGYLLCIK